MKDGIGLAGINLDIMQTIGQFVMLLRTPWVLAGDWNMEPETIKAAGWLHQFGGEVIAPSEHTCSKGMGNTLDFFVVSCSLRPFVKSIGTWQDSPISPHSPVIM
eukprot:7994625-Heterocapsa_arctica.AAC.1